MKYSDEIAKLRRIFADWELHLIFPIALAHVVSEVEKNERSQESHLPSFILLGDCAIGRFFWNPRAFLLNRMPN